MSDTVENQSQVESAREDTEQTKEVARLECADHYIGESSEEEFTEENRNVQIYHQDKQQQQKRRHEYNKNVNPLTHSQLPTTPEKYIQTP